MHTQEILFYKTIKRRNLIESLLGVAIAFIFMFYGLFLEEVFIKKVLYFELAFAGIFISFYLLHYGGNAKTYRESLQKQIHLLSTARYWYVFPVMFGLFGLEIYELITGTNIIFSIINLCLFSLMSLLIIWLNEYYVVNKMKQDLESLDNKIS
jgi:hypothetical protein